MRATAARLSKRRDAARVFPQLASMIPFGKVLRVRVARMRSARAGQNGRGSPPGRQHRNCNIGRIESGFSSEFRRFSRYVQFLHISLFHPILRVQIYSSNDRRRRFGSIRSAPNKSAMCCRASRIAPLFQAPRPSRRRPEPCKQKPLPRPEWPGFATDPRPCCRVLRAGHNHFTAQPAK